jgi:hypothetical protein
MLTLERCRQILGDDCPQSNGDLERLRDQLYGLAGVTVEACLRQRRGNGSQNAPDGALQAIEGAAGHTLPAGFPDAVGMLSEDERYEFEERAAIHEFDGRLDHSTADLAALSEYWRSKHRGN